MPATAPEHFLEELKNTLASEDEIKARILISCLGELDGENRLRALKELSECRTPFSLDLLGQAIEHLNQALRSHHVAVRGRAKSHLIRLGPAAVPLLLPNLVDPDIDFLIHTLNALGEIGDRRAVKPIRQLLQKEPEDANVRFAAYETLGMIPLAQEAYALAEGLSDPVPHVRLAAARAIERNYGKVLATGIENLLQDPTLFEGITRAFLDSQCDRVFESLLQQESFRKPAFSYLRGEAHPDVVSHFARLLREKGFSAWAEEIGRNVNSLPSNRFSILAVDDSRMILNIYKTTLFQLGHQAELFEFPERALERLKEEKPDLLITDLNMPGLNGIEVARLARTLYAKEHLAILMVTTQNRLEDRSEAHAAGVDAILLKPFTKESLKEMIDGLLEGREHGCRTS
ncbi:MAG TPA: response regulator [Chroococcales cyanobacterium]